MAHLASNRERRSQELAAPGIISSPGWSTRTLHSPQLRRYGVSLLVLLLLLLLWEGAVAVRLLPPVLFSPPSVIAITVFSSILDGSLGATLAITLWRVLLSLILGAGAGIGVGVLMGWSRTVRENVDPWIAAAHSIPKIALLPLFIFFLGIGDEPAIVLGALVAFFPMLINTMTGVAQINPIHFQVAANYGARLPQQFVRVILPGSLPMILSGLRIAFNATFITIIAVEMVHGSKGLGVVIWQAWETLQVELLWSSLVLSAFIGIVFNLLLVLVNRRLVPWQTQHHP